MPQASSTPASAKPGRGADNPGRLHGLRSPGTVLTLAGLLALSLGLALYLACRPTRPWLLSFLEPGVARPACQLLAAGWWPSVLHGFAFTCLLAAVLGARRSTAIRVAGFWTAIALLAELSCLGGHLLGSGSLLPTGLNCRADPADVLAAAAGCSLAVLLASFARASTGPFDPRRPPGAPS